MKKKFEYPKSFLEQLREKKELAKRKRWGLRFLKMHEISWLVSYRTIRNQVGLGLVERCE